MYKIVNITDLKLASKFIDTDKVIEISDDQTKMYVADNDYAHKNQTYLSNCIDIVDSTMNSYLNAIDTVTGTYLTSDLTSVYIKNGSLIKQETFDKIMNSNAFLTKEACKKIETNCISYLTELKNRAVSIVMAQLNHSFVKQNSVNRLAFGQEKLGELDINDAIYSITKWSPTNFETGEFSLGSLLYDAPGTDICYVRDFWEESYASNISSFYPECNYQSFDEMANYINNDGTMFSFNSQYAEHDSMNQDFKVRVPSASFDMMRSQTIPIAKLIELFLKRQIKQVIQIISDSYISKMVSIPEISANIQ